MSAGKSHTARCALERTVDTLVFPLPEHKDNCPVECSGVLPDNLVEDMEVVVEGRLEHRDLLCGDKILTRCTSKYQAESAAEPSYTAVLPGQGKRQ